MLDLVPNSKVDRANMGPSGSDRTQVGPMLAPWTLLSGVVDCMNESVLKILLFVHCSVSPSSASARYIAGPISFGPYAYRWPSTIISKHSAEYNYSVDYNYSGDYSYSANYS